MQYAINWKNKALNSMSTLLSINKYLWIMMQFFQFYIDIFIYKFYNLKHISKN